jgi:hypothetical protein
MSRAGRGLLSDPSAIRDEGFEPSAPPLGLSALTIRSSRAAVAFVAATGTARDLSLSKLAIGTPPRPSPIDRYNQGDVQRVRRFLEEEVSDAHGEVP